MSKATDGSADPEPRVSVRLLGPAQWQCPGRPPVPLKPKDAALIAVLALDGAQARSVLCTLLWPQSSAEQAADNLRQRISRLNRAAGCKVFDSGDSVRLHTQVEVDAARPAALGTAELLAAEGLLAGVDLGDHGELDRWLTQARDRIAQACAQALADRAEALEAEGRLHEALSQARRITELLPLLEHGWRRLMRLHYLRDDRAAAQDAFWRLTTLLRDELGIRPSAETLQLMQTVEASSLARSPAPRPVPASLLRPPVLVGRDRAWQAMAEAWQCGQPFLLVGEAGLGKSRLLDAFARGQDGLLCDRAQPGDEHTPYALLGRVLLQVERRFSPALPAALRSELARLRPEFGQAPSSAPAHDAVLAHAIAQMLVLAQGQGLQALVLDDLHNADVASIDALRRLGDGTALRLGLATRPAPGRGLPRPLQTWLEDSPCPVRVELQPLTPNELADLLASLALPSLLDPVLAAQLYRHAGGHPLYTLATLQDALSRGADLNAPSLPTPSSVQALLDARLRGLPPAAQDLLRVAAVAGADLTADRAARLLGCTTLSLADTWAVLEAANVLRGEGFSHDLVYESALRSVPQGVRQALHRQTAALLAEDPVAGAGRIAWHWEQGERWSEAGHRWHAAAEAAHDAGRLVEASELFERAALCHAAAGDDGARFEALHARLPGLELRHGGGAVLAALPEVEALADTGLRRLRCRLARIAALMDGEHAEAAAEQAAIAAREALLHPALLADAEALRAQALVQCRQVQPALDAAASALAAAQAAGDPVQKLHALEALGYVHYAAGRLVEAVAWQRQVVAHAESIGRRAEAAAGEGNVAAQLAAIGDVPASHEHALRTRDRFEAIGLAANSTMGIVNHIVLGASAAALGRFDEALHALPLAVSMAGPQAAVAAQAKARIALAGLWLTLGRADAAREAIARLPEGMGPGMCMQAELVRARAAEMDGTPAARHLQALGRLAAQHADLPLVQSAWFESSFQGAPGPAIERLRAVRHQCEVLGLLGTARALQWRELVRVLELEGEAAARAALELAKQLMPHVACGISAKCHPPQVWLTLWEAFGRAGDHARQAECRHAARRWLDAALTRLPAEHRAAFGAGNPVHRRWLADGAAP